MCMFVSLIRPGQASNLIPKLGTAQQWSTSAEVIFAFTFILTGSIGYTEFSRNALVIKPLPSTSTTNDMYYYEAGIALNKIFLFFRCDLSGRFSQRSDPELRFTISGSTF